MWVGWYIAIFLAVAVGLAMTVRGLAAAKAKERLEIIHTMVTTAAIFVGAVWVWDEFSRERLGVPRLTTTQTIASLPIPDDQVLLDVRTVFTNAGKIRIEVQGGFTRVQQVLPLDKAINRAINPKRFGTQQSEENIREAVSPNKFGAIAWPTLCKHLWDRKFVLEPGENQEVNEQFLVPRTVDVVRVYTYLVSPGDNSFGYEISALHAVEKGAADNAATSPLDSGGYRLLCRIDQRSADKPRARSALAFSLK